MWVPYNANPDGIRGIDCTVRAISAAMGQSWDDTYIGLCLEGYRLKQMPSANAVWGSYLLHHSFHRYPIPDTGGIYTVIDFCEEHPKGLYVLALSGHVICVIDGNYYDFWDSGDELPLYYWEA